VSIKVLGKAEDVATVLDDEEDEMLDSVLRERYEQKKNEQRKQRALLGVDPDTEQDHYELLELGHLRWRATAKQIKDSCMSMQ
jgi:hypothetical protein